jgi:hypothetical protein
MAPGHPQAQPDQEILHQCVFQQGEGGTARRARESMSFTDQKPRVVTEEDCTLPWNGSPDNFRCQLCGHRFKPGDTYRWVYGASRKYELDGKTWGVGNALVCKACDGEDVLDRWVAHVKDGRTRFWWMRG